MRRSRDTDAEIVSDAPGGQRRAEAGPMNDATVGGTASGPSQALVIAGAVVVGWLMAVDPKPWWLWLWDAASTGFADTDRYAVDWRLFLSVVALGVALARWLAGRGRGKG
jgi:hypothetical protein